MLKRQISNKQPQPPQHLDHIEPKNVTSPQYLMNKTNQKLKIILHQYSLMTIFDISLPLFNIPLIFDWLFCSYRGKCINKNCSYMKFKLTNGDDARKQLLYRHEHANFKIDQGTVWKSSFEFMQS